MIKIDKEIKEKHGVIFALVRNGLMCLERRLEPETKFFGFTIIPGGGIESGEAPVDALEREIEEEFAVRIKTYKKLGVVDSMEKGTLNLRHVFLVTDWEGELSNPEKRNEHLNATIEEARTLCAHPISQKVLDLVEEGLGKNR